MATGIPKSGTAQPAPYRLEYDGKSQAAEVLRLAAVEPREHATGDPSVRLLEGDNLAALLWLRSDPTVAGSVRTVYIDPPFATDMAFHGRDVRHAYSDHSAGAEYLEFMRQRLIVLHDLLAPDGTIFLHLDQTIVFEMKLVMDEVFGRSNFRNFVTRKKCNPKNYTRKTFGNVSDHILFYSKSDTYVWHRPYDPWTDAKVADEYPCHDPVTGRRYKKVPIHAPGVRRGKTGQEWRGRLPPTGKHWQYTPSKLDDFDRAGEIYWSPSGNPRRKVFLDLEKGIPAQDIWLQYRDAHNQNIRITGYPTEKNIDLVRRLIEATSNPGDLILDAFSGSGTTLEAAAVTGRRGIGIDLSPVAIEVTLKRLLHGRERMGDFVRPNAVKTLGKTRPSLFDSVSTDDGAE